MWFTNKKLGLTACLLVSCLTADVMAQGLGNVAPSPYRRSRIGGSAGRSFGNSGRSPGSRMGSGIGSRLPGPKLGNTPARNTAPVLSPALNLLPEASTSFAGQYLMRTLPFDQLDQARQDTNRSLGTLQNEISNIPQGPSGDPVVPVRSGLTTTGHSVGYLNTGSYFPGNRR